MRLPILRILLRSFRKNPQAGIIQLLGLSLGIAAFLLLYLLYDYEASYNRALPDSDRLYRLANTSTFRGEESKTGGTCGPLAAALRSDVQGLESASMICYNGNILLRTDKGPFDAQGVYFVDSFYYKVLQPVFLAGNPQTALVRPGQIVLCEKVARQVFGLRPEEAPGTVLGRRLVMRNKVEMEVTGIIANPLPTTDYAFQVLATTGDMEEILEWWDPTTWDQTSSNFEVIAKAKPGVSQAALQAQIPALIQKYAPDNEESKRNFIFQPISSIHYLTEYSTLSERNVDTAVMGVLLLIGTLILLSACINFVNIAVAQSAFRAREVGVRKVLGSSGGALIGRMLLENGLMVLLACLLGILWVELSLPWLNSLLAVEMSVHQLFTVLNSGIMLGLLISLTLLTGLYPAWVAARFQPVTVLKGSTLNLKVGGVSVRKGLVVLQFAISQLLLVGAVGLYQQTSYLLNKPLGFDRDAILLVSLPERTDATEAAFNAQLDQIPGVAGVSFALGAPFGRGNWSTDFEIITAKETTELDVTIKPVDSAYVNLYGLRLLAGTGLQANDSAGLVVNEAFVRKAGLKSPEEALKIKGQVSGDAVHIVGVVADFHHDNFQSAITPVLLQLTGPDWHYRANLKIRSEDPAATLKAIQAAWLTVFPNYIYYSEFYDEHLAGIYQTERRLSTTISAFTVVALLLAVMGLYGLVYILLSQRLREVSIRKVLGANLASLIRVFSKEFVWLLLVANVIAWPIAWFALQEWLQKYVFRIGLSPWLFVGAGVLTLAIAGITISALVARTARVNPATVLRSE